MKTILAVTGTRADYGLLRPVLSAIEAHPRLTLKLAATGTHLETRFGLTVEDIRKDRRVDYEVPLHLSSDRPAEVACAVGRAVIGFVDVIERAAPNLVLVLGDRYEILGAAVAAAYSAAFVGHIHGGDVSDAGYDEYARHAITKFSHLHFAVSEKSAERIRRMGEDPRRVFVVGAPGLDTVLHASLPSPDELRRKYGLPPRPIILFAQHPVSVRPDEAAEELRISFAALERIDDAEVVALYPNADAGGLGMIEAYERMPRRDGWHVFRSLPHEDYLGLLKMADVLVGNSSSGILEAPSLHVPVVNLGTRQAGRERADNILDVPHDTDAIRAAIHRARHDEAFRGRVRDCVSPYGDGRAGERIAKLLDETTLDDALRHKHLHV